MNKIWIDTTTGTWGNVEDLVTIDLDTHFPLNTTINAAVVFETLDNASDQEIMDIGNNYGTKLAG